MTAPSPESVGATLRAFLSDSGALMATAAIEGATVTATADGVLAVERDPPGGVGAAGHAAGDAAEQPLDPGGQQALDLGMNVKRLPPMDVDPGRGEVNGSLGGLEHLAEAVMALARALGAPSVALVQWPTYDEETPFAISARDGEGIVLVIGDESYEMDPSWPGRPAPNG